MRFAEGLLGDLHVYPSMWTCRVKSNHASGQVAIATTHVRKLST